MLGSRASDLVKRWLLAVGIFVQLGGLAWSVVGPSQLALNSMHVTLSSIALFVAMGLVFVVLQTVGVVPGLGTLSAWLQARVRGALEFLVEASPTPGSGLVAHASLLFLRVGGRLFSVTGRRVLFTRHTPALLLAWGNVEA